MCNNNNSPVCVKWHSTGELKFSLLYTVILLKYNHGQEVCIIIIIMCRYTPACEEFVIAGASRANKHKQV